MEGGAKFKLSGRYTVSEQNCEDFILGFSVAWNNDTNGNSESITSWAGEYIASENKIRSKWIHSKHTSSSEDGQSFLIGFDEFTRPDDKHACTAT